jgi:glycosyltransferase involved in cell wall biosynthesis
VKQALTVLSVAYPLFPVGPDSGGGAEQILFLIEKGLVEAGHHSIVVAAKGSHVSGDLVETPVCDGEITDEIRTQAQQEHLRSIERILQERKVDVIHFHGLDFYTYQPRTKIRRLATLHLPLAWYPEAIFSGQVQLNCVSHSQASTLGLPVVQNGIDVQRYTPARTNKGHLLWLGRICPEKGVHVALQVAHRLNLPMIVAGPVHPFRFHQDYFAEQVEPLLDDIRRYVGPVGISEKLRLYAGARCVLIPSSVAETSSLVAMEAISSGTPVVAFRSGALPEVVEHGRTGFIVDSEDDMVGAVQRIDEISSETCRARAIGQFSAERMVEGYLRLYRELLG